LRRRQGRRIRHERFDDGEDVPVVEVVGERLARRRVEQDVRPQRPERGERAPEERRSARIAGRQVVGDLLERL